MTAQKKKTHGIVKLNYSACFDKQHKEISEVISAFKNFNLNSSPEIWINKLCVLNLIIVIYIFKFVFQIDGNIYPYPAVVFFRLIDIAN